MNDISIKAAALEPNVAGAMKGLAQEIGALSAFRLESCIHCGISMEEIAPRMFSFNSPYGACPTCSGLGSRITGWPCFTSKSSRLTSPRC